MSEPQQQTRQHEKKIPWQQQGSTPDYRFSLANERTFLAWIRTALAFLAGAIAIDQFALTLAPTVVREGMAIFLSLACALLTWMAYRRWVANELAMRTGKNLPYTRLLLVITVFVIGIAVILTLLIFMV
ncbi:hypothetical protein DDT52_10950 [Brenneria roseae subsp. roseae]|uniref:YidH family protein n=1 Tax=Brenneria roseae TaxID=1509241 RepID=UPI000D61EC31|nr:DUF202 domain-containing protein [Brenneria roseae]PWC19865.1 hypothetical protein DDT52_10950 [Brenneria roseae subsp. roseae]